MSDASETSDSYCPIARTALILGSRWTAEIIRELLDHGPRRFQDLQDAVTGIAPNTLSARLKMLEQSGVVEREFYESHPPRAAYKLTEKGHKMSKIIGAMRAWGLKYG
ncbi:MAG: helix-turn-helix domain-containing protein [Pseudomonadota bacterium]